MEGDGRRSWLKWAGQSGGYNGRGRSTKLVKVGGTEWWVEWKGTVDEAG